MAPSFPYLDEIRMENFMQLGSLTSNHIDEG